MSSWLHPSLAIRPSPLHGRGTFATAPIGADEVTLVARRLVAAGEELTADYALWELDPEWVSPFRCRCGAAECRGVITGRDWEDPELQRRYAAHFHPVLNARIGAPLR